MEVESRAIDIRRTGIEKLPAAFAAFGRCSRPAWCEAIDTAAGAAHDDFLTHGSLPRIAHRRLSALDL
jgi:hypothetical protein